MNDNVIEAAQRFRNGTDGSASRGDPRANEEKLRNSERMKLQQIQQLCNAKPLPRFNKADCLLAARAVGILRNKLGHGEMARVKKEFARPDRVMIRPDSDSSDRAAVSEKQAKLTAKISEYLRAAREFAKVGGIDLEDAQIGVLRGTRFWQNWSRPPVQRGGDTEIDEAASQVAMLLQQLSARIIREADLHRLFARMRRVPGAWDISLARFRSSGMSCLFRSAYEEGYEEWDEAPPLPSMPLVRLWYAQRKLPVRVARDGAAEPYSDNRYSRRPLAENESDEFCADVTLYREIRLALGPTVNADTLGPLFESRPYAELLLVGKNGGKSRSGPLDPGHLHAFDVNASAILLDGLWRRVTPLADIETDFSNHADIETIAKALSGVHVQDPLLWDITPLGEDKQCFENNYVSWTPVDAAHVAHWLDPIKLNRASYAIEYIFAEPPANPARGNWFPRSCLGYFIETAINDGRLDRVLRSEIERIRIAFEQHENQWRTLMREQTAEQIATFKSDLSAVAPSQNGPEGQT